MSRKLIDAIASGDNLEAESEFKSSISSNVGDTLETIRKELSQNYVSNNESVIEEEGKPYIKQKPDGTWCVYDAEGNIVSEHESEDEAKAALPNKKDDEDDDDEVAEAVLDENGGLLGYFFRKKTGIKNPLNIRQRAQDAVTDKVVSGIGSLFSKKAKKGKSPGAMGGEVKK